MFDDDDVKTHQNISQLLCIVGKELSTQSGLIGFAPINPSFKID